MVTELFTSLQNLSGIAGSSATVIDLIIANDSMHTIHFLIILSNLTDHFPIMRKITTSETVRKTKKKCTFTEIENRLFQNYSTMKLTRNEGYLCLNSLPQLLIVLTKFAINL